MLTTVEQYRELPDQPGAFQELRLGEVVALPLAKANVQKLQYRLSDLQRPIAQEQGVVTYTFPFRALPQYDLRCADVAFISQTRWNEIDDDDNLRGSSELVIEVLSPSNTKNQMREKAALCLSTGCEEFWLVDPNCKTVDVTRKDGDYVSYRIGDYIPLARFDSQLEVAASFAL